MDGIHITVSMAPILRALEQAPQQVNFAVSKGLNTLANAAQAAQKDHMRRAFHLRREQFVLRSIKIAKEDRARKDSWAVTIRVQMPDDRHFLDDHEEGGTRQAQGKFRWSPNHKDVFHNRVITRANQLAVKSIRMTDAGGGEKTGTSRTFMIRTKQGETLVLQRQGAYRERHSARGEKGRYTKGTKRPRSPRVRLLYRLVSSTKIPARLEFVDTVGRVVHAQWQQVMDAELQRAIANAK